MDAKQTPRMVGTEQEPRPAKPGNRYCYMCDEFMSTRVCKACGLTTEKASE